MQIHLHKRKTVYLILLLCFSLDVYSIEQEKYLHFTEVDGLPRNISTCIEQDEYGYLWIGTTNGIAQYDGNSFYSHKELSGISVFSLLYDSHKTLWVASGQGLYKYNRLKNQFELIVEGFIPKVQEFENDIYFIMYSGIGKVVGNKYEVFYNASDLTDFFISKEGIWLAKSTDGVWLVDRNNLKNTLTKYLKGKYAALINKIDDKLFVGCYNGQLYCVQKDGKLIQLEFNNHYYPKKFVKVGQEIWLATDGNGIIIFDKNLRYKRTLSRSKNTEASINSNSIYDIYPGKNNEIWLASYGAGLTCVLPDNLLFQNILPEKGNENSLVANEGVSVFVKQPLIYFGTNYGLSAWNENTNQFRNLSSEKLRKDLNGNKVTAINIDANNNLWIGTYDGLLGKYTSDFNLIRTYHPSSNTANEMQQIVHITEIDKSNLLILTQFQNNILINFNIETEKTNVFKLNSKGSNITYMLINSIRRNQHGELLALIADKGLYSVNWKENFLENKFQEMNKKLNSYMVDFYQDKKGRYWIASTSGLVCTSTDGKYFKRYTTKDGLPSNNLSRIEPENDQFLWISSISGICRLNTQTDEVLNFNLNDGLPANEFYDRISAKTNDGRIIFGSLAGFTIIDPSKVNSGSSKTDMIISDIAFQNQSIRNTEGMQLLKKPLEETKEIWLPYNKNSFSIHFFKKDKNFLKYHNYAYRLKGLEKSWTFLTKTNFANFTNLSPGTYTFEVKSADKTKDGVTTSIVIHIRAPWFLSWYAFLVYFIILVIILYLSVYAYLKRLELKKEKEISEFKIQKEHELTEKKLSFFTNVSHDLKTPLTLIDAPVNDLLQSGNLSPEQVNKLMIINRNSKRLYKLITDLLDFRKVTQKEHVLEISETHISDIVTDIYEAFKEECKHKEIDFNYTVEEQLVGYVDAKKIEKILWNLLSNALKFTGKGGCIVLNIKELIVDNQKYIKFEIIDTGIGIPENEKNKIFDRFFKVQSSSLLNQDGTGIGLSIVKELVDIHLGQISVDSALGQGSTFTVIIPSGQEAYQHLNIDTSESIESAAQPIGIKENTETQSLFDNKKQYNLPTLLIVEDNSDLREYLCKHFEKKFKVCSAKDGLEGLKQVKDSSPDIIITDVQMPNMNGYEFCKEIRHNFDTSHIPVIMLTANNTTEQQIEGLSTGADSYITKPFDINILDAQVTSLTENRKLLRSKFIGIETPENLEKVLPQKDIDFILDLKLFIEENMMDQNLSVEMLSEHFAVSIAQLHRKIKYITGSTPNNLIKSIRLKKAYLLIKEGRLRVSEAAYQTGFSDPNYFTICFKKEFGENPSKIGPFTNEANVDAPVKLLNNEPVNINKPELHEPVSLELQPLLLIAEDNEDMRNYICTELNSYYKIIAVADGMSAYDKALEAIPDIILSDIMMPAMDGIELCRKLKTDDRTSHVPFVLLTAKDTDENTIEGFENGADDYISKPFNIQVLKARLDNLVLSRIALRKIFIKEPDATPKDISPTNHDEKFLKKAFEIVEKYLTDPNFDVHVFASELGVSRAQLYRKIDALSGQSVNEFIRIVRLKKAADLLINSNLQISEIVEKVGFNSFAYFTKSFKEYFGVTPSQYKR